MSSVLLTAVAIFSVTSSAVSIGAKGFEVVHSDDTKYCKDSQTSLVCRGNKGLQLNTVVKTGGQNSVFENIDISNFVVVRATTPQRAKKVFIHDVFQELDLTVSKHMTDIRIDNAITADTYFYSDVISSDLVVAINNVVSASLLFRQADRRGNDRHGNIDHHSMSSLAVYKSGLKSIEKGVSSSGNIIMVESTIGDVNAELYLVAKEINIVSSKLLHVTEAKADIILIDDSTIQLSENLHPHIDADELRVTNSHLNLTPSFLEDIKRSVRHAYFENNHFHGSNYIAALKLSGNGYIFNENTFDCDCSAQLRVSGRVGDVNYCRVGQDKMTINSYIQKLNDTTSSVYNQCKRSLVP